jgi:starvation-inducible DNA-binding protein
MKTMGEHDPIPSPLDDHARDVIGQSLQATLVDLLDLSLVAKQAHWNVVGRRFRDIHLQLDELVDLCRKYVDEVAERAAATGVAPDGRAATVADSSALPAFPAGFVRDDDVINRIVESVDGVARRLRPRVDEAGKLDPVTQDLYVEILRALEKTRWMWSAHCNI